jgi:hypothetical protein
VKVELICLPLCYLCVVFIGDGNDWQKNGSIRSCHGPERHAFIKRGHKIVYSMVYRTSCDFSFLLQWETQPKYVIESFVLLLSPFAPHLAEELWFRLGHPQSLAYEQFPEVTLNLSYFSTASLFAG